MVVKCSDGVRSEGKEKDTFVFRREARGYCLSGEEGVLRDIFSKEIFRVAFSTGKPYRNLLLLLQTKSDIFPFFFVRELFIIPLTSLKVVFVLHVVDF